MNTKERKNGIKITSLMIMVTFFVLCLAGMQIRVAAEEPETLENATVDGITYTLDKEKQTAIVKRYSQYKDETCKEVTIPMEITYENNKYTVSEIGDNAFVSASYLKKITLPQTINKIGFAAFLGCTSLEDINLPVGIKIIKSSAFYLCISLKEIEIPNTVEVIENVVFYGCSKLKKIKIPGSVKEIQGACFRKCTALEEIEFAEGLTTLGGGMFEECPSLKKVILPQTLKGVADYTFSGCQSLEQIIIPEGVETINRNAIVDCDNLEYVYYPKHLENQFYHVKAETATCISYTINEDGTISLNVEKMREGADIQLPADIGGREIASVTGPEGVDLPVVCTKHRLGAYSKDTKEHWYVCDVCKKEIRDSHVFTSNSQPCVCGYIPFTVSIQPADLQLAYASPNAILSVTAKATFGTENIAYQWYEGGKAIAGATAPTYEISKSKPVGNYTYTCKLTSGSYSQVTKAATVTVKAPAKGSKYKDDKNMAVYKVTNARADGKGTVEYAKSVNKKKSTVTIPVTVKIGGITYKVTSIAKNAFKGNKNIKHLTIEKNVEKIGARAFYGCKTLKTITIKTSKLKAKKIGTAAFKKTPANAKIKVPKKKLKAYTSMLWKKGVNKKAKIRKM